MIRFLYRMEPEVRHDAVDDTRPDSAESIFEIRQQGSAPLLKITGCSSFRTTKAAAYCFVPSITALKFIASQRGT